MLLNTHSYYSLRYGTLSLEALVRGMLQCGHDTVVLTDINNSSGSLEFLRLGRRHGLNVLAGMEFRNGDNLLYIGIARSSAGFQELNAFRTYHNRVGRPLPERAPAFRDVSVVYPYGKVSAEALRDHEYLGVRPVERNLIRMVPRAWLERCVILAPVTFAAEDYRLHRQLRAIDHNLLFSQLEPHMAAPPDEVMMSRTALLDAFRDFPQLIRNTERLLGNCGFDFNFGSMKTKQTFTGDRGQDRALLQRLAIEGMISRYGSRQNAAAARVREELMIIEQLNFSSYFLITHDICRFARERGFHYVGRGSGANSVVAYCLGITDVDPIALNLPFERFLNPKRQHPPDFDIDFSWRDRDTVFAYIFGRFPSEQVALMGAMSTFRSRSILRELGKVYGLPKAEIDRLVHEPEHLLNRNEVTDTIMAVYNRMADFPNQRTIHASGVLIGEQPLTHYSALDYPPKGLPTVQFDMLVAEQIGFEKFDILSQRGIGHIRDCCAWVRREHGIAIDVDRPQRFFADPAVNDRLRRGDTVGCFYLESPAMRQLLVKLACDNYLTLVAASSILRPGVASSGMMAEFIRRHRDPASVRYPHPVFREQLAETYGVMVYQEDVMKIASAYGGLDMADADVLRRMISRKQPDQVLLCALREKFFANCHAKGYDDEVTREIWRQMESFAGYSFNKAHSASYAVESYQSLYLKTYFPREFMVAVLNNYGGFYDRKVYINELRRVGGRVQLPCVNHSGVQSVISGESVYLGFDCLLNLEAELARRIPEERRRGGPYTGLADFVHRTGAPLTQLIMLIRCGAFRFTGVGKKELLWEAHLLLAGDRYSGRPVGQPLFFQETTCPVLPPLQTDPVEDLYDELELLGFPVSGSMFDLARSPYRGDVTAEALAGHAGRTVRLVGDFVLEKTLNTKRGERMQFGTWLDVQGTLFDSVHFPATLRQYPLRGAGLYLLEGKVTVDYGYPTLEVIRCGKMPLKADPRSE